MSYSTVVVNCLSMEGTALESSLHALLTVYLKFYHRLLQKCDTKLLHIVRSTENDLFLPLGIPAIM